MTIDDLGNRFLQVLFDQTGGDAAQAASMYHIGEMLDLDKTASVRTAEMLMGEALVEIRSLSGGIGLTTEGIDAVRALSGAARSDTGQQKLCRSVVLDTESIRWVEQALAELKANIGRLTDAYDPLTELIADLKTLDAQLMSPRPKTAVVREVLRSVREQLKDGDPHFSTKIGNFMDD